MHLAENRILVGGGWPVLVLIYAKTLHSASFLLVSKEFATGMCTNLLVEEIVE